MPWRQRTRSRCSCFAAALLISLVVLAARPGRALGDPDHVLQEAQRAYARGDYRVTIRLLTGLLYPTIKLSAESQVLTAYKLLGISFVFEKDRSAASKQFLAILSLRPDFQLDSLVDPEAAVELFESVKRQNEEKLRRIRDRIEEERRRREEARRTKPPPADPRREAVVELTRQRRSVWVNFLPFGAGQFQNGHRGKAYTLLALQAAFGAVSVSSAIWHRVEFSGPLTKGSPEADLAERVAVTQVVSGALFFGALAYGIIDALIYYERETVFEKRYQRRISLEPSFGPREVGLGMSFRLD
jgi:hypothetical protein